jgi:uncharacterized coiled-coil DUF342 family protein
MRLFLIIAVVCLAGAGAYYFVGPDRTQVAKKNVLDRLDGVLGKLDVQRQEIDTGIKSTAQAIDGIRKAKIKAQVKMEQIDEKAKPHEEKVAQCDQALLKLRDLLAAMVSVNLKSNVRNRVPPA